MQLPETIAVNLGTLPYGVGAVVADTARGDRTAARAADFQAAILAVAALFPNCPTERVQQGTVVRRDSLGKPFVEWREAMAEWAAQEGVRAEHCPISNTSDGDLHLVFAAHSDQLAGVGIDAVWLPRLMRAGKDRAYLLRFARQFMSEAEWTGFNARWHNAPEDELRVAVAAHFSLMEAASKACGTGLKIGLGMGRSASLPMDTLGAAQILPAVNLLIKGEAISRLEALGVAKPEAFWGVTGTCVIALVLFWQY